MIERIDHVAKAKDFLVRARQVVNSLVAALGDDEELSDFDIVAANAAASNGFAEAQAHAVLALVEQQRIANVIALSVGDWDHGQAIDALVVRPQMGADPYPLRPEIAAALGLEAGETDA